MPSDLNLKRLRNENLGGDRFSLPTLPRIPQSVLDRFPDMNQWVKEMELWRQALVNEVNNKLGQPQAGPK